MPMSRYNPATFAAKRLQAQRNAEQHIASLLFGAAKSIVSLAYLYRTGLNDISANSQFTSQAQKLVEDTEEKVEAYITAYAKASSKLLGIEEKVVTSYLADKIFGKTFVERNRAYAHTFAEDIIKMCVAGIKLGYTQNQLLAAVRTGYKDPFTSSVITKAQRKGHAIKTPLYGKGIYHSAYQNIVRNAVVTISLSWAEAEKERGKKDKAIGFTVHRGSSYPCETCEHETTYRHTWKDPFPPYHPHCACFVKFFYSENPEPSDKSE